MDMDRGCDPITGASPPAMLDDTRRVIQGVRRALIELYASVGVDPGEPQAVARKLGLNRNLTWKLSRVIGSSDPFAALRHLPGEQGVGLATEAFARAGAPEAVIEHVRTAIGELDSVVEVHAGDRGHFELTLESMGLYEPESRMESGRELAFRGNSMIWGVQARTRLTTAMIAPSPGDAGRIDYLLVGSWIGFRRLRPESRWRLARRQIHDDRGERLDTTPLVEHIDAQPDPQAPQLVREFCSSNMPAVEPVEQGGTVELMLPGGPVGNLAAFDCTFGYIARGVPRFRDAHNEFGSSAASISLPVETLVFDILVHRDLPFPLEPELAVYGFPHGGVDNPAGQTIQNRLPIPMRAVELAGMPPAVATPLVPFYNDLIGRMYQRMGWEPSAFRGVRLLLPYPPMSSMVVMRWPLPEAGA
ncbi:MAG: hypothetical protein IPM64_06515 [Phycisphaerales bacterium]|nr:hypothetical protein [Phycisphaerales bacterium]